MRKLILTLSCQGRDSDRGRNESRASSKGRKASFSDDDDVEISFSSDAGPAKSAAKPAAKSTAKPAPRSTFSDDEVLIGVLARFLFSWDLLDVR